MGSNRSFSVRHYYSWLIAATLSGAFYGTMAYFLKLSLGTFSFTPEGIGLFIANPFAWVTGILVLLGFLLMQKALHDGLVTVVIPIISGISIIIPVLLGVALLGEVLTTFQWIGVLLIIIGTAGLDR